FPRMQAAVSAAQSRIDFELYLLEAGDCAEAFLPLLESAARRGVQVRCLFDEYGSQGLGGTRLEVLREAGVELRLYNPTGWRQGVLNLYRDHRKLLLVDGEHGFVGGTGLTDEFWQPQAEQSDWHEGMVAMRGPVLGDWKQLFDRRWRACEQR